MPPWGAATCRRFGPEVGPKRRQGGALQGGVLFEASYLSHSDKSLIAFAFICGY